MNGLIAVGVRRRDLRAQDFATLTQLAPRAASSTRWVDLPRLACLRVPAYPRRFDAPAGLCLRLPMARDADLQGAVNRIFCTELDRLLQRLGEECAVRRGATGLVAPTRLADGSLNLHVHFHAAAIDGVNTTDEHGAPRFHFLPALTPTDIHWVCSTVATRVCNLPRHRGLLRDRADGNDCAVRLTPSTALDAAGKRRSQGGASNA
ncbi:MAG: hypothetical protein MUF54_22510 [Polyangiaceae bacterium]|nr:hypothetical protein [Polyangiaceae bacterium]